jgi:antirestriction protein ArdC
MSNPSSKIEQTCEKVAAQIIAALDAGVCPWAKTWTGAGVLPENALTGHVYGGVFNPLVLMLAGSAFGDNRWAGASQWFKSRNPVKKGETGTGIFFPRFKCSACHVTVGRGKRCKNGHPIVKTSDKYFAGFGSSVVFNNQQTRSPLATEGVKEVDPAVGFERAASLVANIDADMRHGGGRAFYSIREDYIMVPEAGQFNTPADYWAVVLHEHAHWSGAKDRLNRKGIVDFSFFGSSEYAHEELVAELGSAFLCHHIGVAREGLMDNHAAYIASWKKKLKEDPMVIRKAATEAGRVMRFLLDKGEGKGEG